MKRTGARWWIVVFAIPGLMLALTVAIPLIFADRLPDPIASHWDISGVPDGHLPLWALIAISAGIVLVAWMALVLSHARGTATAAMVAVVYFIGSLMAGLQLFTVYANLDAPNWQDAGHIGFIQVMVLVAAAVAVGALGWFLAGTDPKAVYEGSAGSLPSIDLGPDELAVWVSKSESVWLPLVAAVVFVVGIIVSGVVGLILFVVSILGLFFSAARVGAGEQGVSIGLGWWGWPRRTIPLDAISRVEILDVEPMSYGGWGFRVVGGRALTGTWALVIRKGPGIRIVRAEATDIVVTVDDAYRGAGLVNDLLRRTTQLVT